MPLFCLLFDLLQLLHSLANQYLDFFLILKIQNMSAEEKKAVVLSEKDQAQVDGLVELILKYGGCKLPMMLTITNNNGLYLYRSRYHDPVCKRLEEDIGVTCSLAEQTWKRNILTGESYLVTKLCVEDILDPPNV